MSDLISYLNALETALTEQGGGKFRLTVRHARDTDTFHVAVFAPAKNEFVIERIEIKEAERRPGHEFTWPSAIGQISRSGYGEIDVEITKSSKRTVKTHTVTTSYRSLQ